MNWARRNWIVVVFLLAIAASFYASDKESQRRDRHQHAQIVAQCLGTSGRSALVVNGQLVLARRVRERNAQGDAKSAQQYTATARSLVERLPAPKGLRGSFQLAEVAPVVKHGMIVRYTLTPRALALQKAGCEQANP